MIDTAPAINHIPCHIRQVEFVLAEVACDHCGVCSDDDGEGESAVRYR